VIFIGLLLLTLSVMLLPILPALIEWRWPSDVVPLQIDEADALDPPVLAHRFAALLQEVLRSGAIHLGESAIAQLKAGKADAPWPFSPLEKSDNRSDRVWRIEGDIQLPTNFSFHAEVSASADLRTAPHAVYRALWADGALHLAAHSSVLRWAHGAQVRIAEACVLAGRVTATQSLVVGAGVQFTLLHAPVIDFAPSPRAVAASAPKRRAMTVWPAVVRWDAQLQRGLAGASLVIEDGSAWQGDLVCMGDLSLGADCLVDGSLKARGDLQLGRGCRVIGSVFAEGSIHMAEGCTVLGAVVSETALHVGAGGEFGAAGRPTTVAAPQLELATGVRAHGTVWAGEKGWTAGERVPVPIPGQGLRINMTERAVA